MAAEEQTVDEIEQLRGQWLREFEEAMAAARYTPKQLKDMASRYRTLAKTTESRGMQRAAQAVAERYEHAARDQAPAGR